MARHLKAAPLSPFREQYLQLDTWVVSAEIATATPQSLAGPE